MPLPARADVIPLMQESLFLNKRPPLNESLGIEQFSTNKMHNNK